MKITLYGTTHDVEEFKNLKSVTLYGCKSNTFPVKFEMNLTNVEVVSSTDETVTVKRYGSTAFTGPKII